MPVENSKPVIFLAFANDASRPLAKLVNEYRNLMEVLKQAENVGLCEKQAGPNVQPILQTREVR